MIVFSASPTDRAPGPAQMAYVQPDASDRPTLHAGDGGQPGEGPGAAGDAPRGAPAGTGDASGGAARGRNRIVHRVKRCIRHTIQDTQRTSDTTFYQKDPKGAEHI